MTFQFASQSFAADAADAECGAHPILDNPTDRALVFVLEHCDGDFTVNLQGTNGSGWQSHSFANFADADAYADAAAIEHEAIKVEL